MSERRKFTAYEKETVYERYNGHCAICGRPVSKKKMTISHRTPLSKGGTNGMDNLLLSCWSCSQAKQNLSMEEFYQKIGELFFYNADEIAKVIKDRDIVFK